MAMCEVTTIRLWWQIRPFVVFHLDALLASLLRICHVPRVILIRGKVEEGPGWTVMIDDK